jgi:hypothetical protein
VIHQCWSPIQHFWRVFPDHCKLNQSIRIKTRTMKTTNNKEMKSTWFEQFHQALCLLPPSRYQNPPRFLYGHCWGFLHPLFGTSGALYQDENKNVIIMLTYVTKLYPIYHFSILKKNTSGTVTGNNARDKIKHVSRSLVKPHITNGAPSQYL